MKCIYAKTYLDPKGRHRIEISDELARELLRRSGVRSKRRRIQKKAIAKQLNKMLLQALRDRANVNK